jgi:DNA-binding SARP family transcriptional activator
VTELRAELRTDVDLADEAVRLWTDLDDPIGRARAELVRAHLGPAETARLVAEDVRGRMQAIGCHALDGRLEDLLARVGDPETVLVVEALGRFRVRRRGQVIPRSAWQSRKARDLLKILVSRRGRPVPRDELVLLLWPDTRVDEDAVASKRLTVVLSTLRAVVDPDGGADVLVTGDGAVHLDLDQVRVDVERMLQAAAQAGRFERSGRRADSLERWRGVEAMYTGDFCEEDPYADWAFDLREQVRHAYVRAAAAVAVAEHEAGRYEEAARYWLRLLERDPFDERGHLGLVRSLDLAGRLWGRAPPVRHLHGTDAGARDRTRALSALTDVPL